MGTNIYACILAGGHGSRMGNVERPKQFLDIGNKPIIIHTIEKFLLHPEFEKVVVLTPGAWLSHMEDIAEKHLTASDRLVVIEGGDDRNDTLMNAISHIEENYGIDDDTIILTHDSVRPFVSHRIIMENIECAKEFGACDTVVPASDTIVESGDGKIIEAIPERIRLYQGQTPQTFKGKKLKTLYEALSDEEKESLTDACKIFTLNGETVHLVDGDVSNIKITYPTDIRIANALIGGEAC